MFVLASSSSIMRSLDPLHARIERRHGNPGSSPPTPCDGWSHGCTRRYDEACITEAGVAKAAPHRRIASFRRRETSAAFGLLAWRKRTQALSAGQVDVELVRRK